LVFENGKNWQGSAQLSLLSPSPLPSEFCNDENNSVIRSAMDALRNSKKMCLLAVAILFLFTFFNLILDAPLSNSYNSRSNKSRSRKAQHHSQEYSNGNSYILLTPTDTTASTIDCTTTPQSAAN
jgi:hypothetical protein